MSVTFWRNNHDFTLRTDISEINEVCRFLRILFQTNLKLVATTSNLTVFF